MPARRISAIGILLRNWVLLSAVSYESFATLSMRSRGKNRTPNIEIQNLAFYLLNYPRMWLLGWASNPQPSD